MKCSYHPEVEAVTTCVSCGKDVCILCKTLVGEQIYCQPCADAISPKRPAAPRIARGKLILWIALFAVAVVILIILLTL